MALDSVWDNAKKDSSLWHKFDDVESSGNAVDKREEHLSYSFWE